MQISAYCNMTYFGKTSKASVLSSNAKKSIICKQQNVRIAIICKACFVSHTPFPWLQLSIVFYRRYSSFSDRRYRYVPLMCNEATINLSVHEFFPTMLFDYDFYSKTNKMHQCIKFILFWNDTLHVSDGLPSIINSSRLYIQHQSFVKHTS